MAIDQHGIAEALPRPLEQRLEPGMIGPVDRLDPVERLGDGQRMRVDLDIFRDDAGDGAEPAGNAHRADIGIGRQFAVEHAGIELIGLAIDVEPGAREMRPHQRGPQRHHRQEQFV